MLKNNKPDKYQDHYGFRIFHISFFKALLINEGETTRGERESGRNDQGRTGIGAK
jgi:hypothetical protein